VIPRGRENLPRWRELGGLRGLYALGHRCLINISAFTRADAWSSRRHASWWAAATLLIVVSGTVVALVSILQVKSAASDLGDGLEPAIGYVLPYGVVGAFLISRRSDLPFGWLLAGSAVALAIGIGWAGLAINAASHGDRSVLVALAIPLQTAAFLPTAVQGLINVRFPSGRITSRWGRILERAIIIGIALGTLGGLLGSRSITIRRSDSTTTELHNPLTPGPAIGRIAQDVSVAVPLVILLGLIAGLAIVGRAWKATGIERDQLRWRALGVVLALALFPLAINGGLPGLANTLDGLFFVTTLAIPVLRYRLWAVDTIIRRSFVYALTVIVLTASFVAVAAIGAILASERVGLVIAAAVIGVAFAPVLSRSRRLVDHYFYGARNDPLPGGDRCGAATRSRGRARRGVTGCRHRDSGVTATAVPRDRAPR
jgi:two-component system, NarL family, sensor kinase